MIKQVLATLLVAAPAYAVPWTNSYQGTPGDGDYASPSLATDASTTPSLIRGNRQTTQYRLSPEHYVGNSDGLNHDNGLHRLGSARCYFTNTEPTSLVNSYSTSPAIADHDNSGNTAFGGEADLDDPATNAGANAEDDVGSGRCWIDLDGPDNVAGNGDDNTLMVYLGVAGAGNGSWVNPFSAGGFVGQNIVFHSSFLATDGDGDILAAAIPIGWAAAAAGAPSTSAYAALPVSEGDGFAYRSTTTTINEGITQSLVSPKASQSYRVRVRVSPDTASGCTLAVTGGVGVPTAVSAGTGAYETLEITAKSNGIGGTMVLQLLGAIGGGEVCDWSNPTIVEIASTPQIGTTIFNASAAVPGGFIAPCNEFYAAGNCEDLVSVDVTPPGPGYVAFVWASVPIRLTGVAGACRARIQASTGTIVETGQQNQNDYEGEIMMTGITTLPLAPATTVKFQVDVMQDPGLATCAVNEDVTGLTQTVDIRVVLFPTGF